MRAVCWYSPEDVRVETVPDPSILNPRDAIVRVTSTSICGSDLHLYGGYVPTMRTGDILGHEFMGEVVEVGSAVSGLVPGQRVVVPAVIACGRCWYCRNDLWSACDNSNPNAALAEAMYGFSPAAIYGYSHLYGGYAGGQAQYVRVPFADVGPLPVPEGVTDEQVLFLSDALATGYMFAEYCDITPGDTIAVWGCGSIGQFAIRSAFLLGAGRVIAIDRIPERLRMAEGGGAEVLDYEGVDVVEELKAMTGGRGPDACIDAVGMEAHVPGVRGLADRTLQALRVQLDRPNALREAIQACRKGGTLSVPGVYGSFLNSFPFGSVFNKGLTLRTGQVHVQRYLRPLLERIVATEIDPTFVITHRMPLDDAPEAYRMFRDKQDGCIKVILDPWGVPAPDEREAAAAATA
jgi:threonine dehydrogenase-like Zn-dependent dehydrogenase